MAFDWASPASNLNHAAQKLYFPALDGLRFFAFLLVFIHHLPPSTDPTLALLHSQGWVGVHLFLFLSAYLLTTILLSEQHASGTISIRKFYIRRSLRIWPLYFMFCVGAFVLSIVHSPAIPIEWFRFGGLMVFIDNIYSGLRTYNPIPYTAHLWTISLEEQFYLILPLLLARTLAAPKLLLRGLFACWFFFLVIRIVAVLFEAPHPMIWTSVFSADSLLLGTALAVIRSSPASTVLVRLTLVIVGLVSLFSGAFLPPIYKVGVHQIIVYSLVAVGAAALTMAALHEPLLGFLKKGPFRYLGKISYGLYIFHLVGIAFGIQLATWIGSMSWWVVALTAFAATSILSVLSYELFERQFLKLKQRFETVHSRPL